MHAYTFESCDVRLLGLLLGKENTWMLKFSAALSHKKLRLLTDATTCSCRIMHVGLKITRPPETVARYKMIKHTKRKPADWRKR